MVFSPLKNTQGKPVTSKLALEREVSGVEVFGNHSYLGSWDRRHQMRIPTFSVVALPFPSLTNLIFSGS